MTPEFKRTLHRAVLLYLQEIWDGCNDCQARGKHGQCDAHKGIVWDLVEGKTRKYIKIDNNLKVHYLVQPGGKPT